MATRRLSADYVFIWPRSAIFDAFYATRCLWFDCQFLLFQWKTRNVVIRGLETMWERNLWRNAWGRFRSDFNFDVGGRVRKQNGDFPPVKIPGNWIRPEKKTKQQPMNQRQVNVTYSNERQLPADLFQHAEREGRNGVGSEKKRSSFV